MTTGHPGAGRGWEPEEDSYADPYAQPPGDPTAAAAAAAAAYGGYDPLTDPLPGEYGGQYGEQYEQPYDPYAYGPEAQTAYTTEPPPVWQEPYAPPTDGGQPAWDGTYPQATPGDSAPVTPAAHTPSPHPGVGAVVEARHRAAEADPTPSPPGGGRAARRRAAAAEAEARGDAAETDTPLGGGRAARRRAGGGGDPETVGLRRPAAATAAGGGGRAARRRAARGAPAPVAEPPPGAGRAARRKAAKAAAKAARHTGTAISNIIGELFITTGVLLLLFVVYQLWWTNYEARAHEKGVRDELQEQWDNGGGTGGNGGGGENGPNAPGAFEPGEGFAVLYLPTLDVEVTIAETTDKEDVLDRGLVGHYTEEDGLPTAMPGDEQGNVGLAGHRNTHGEPFRHINQLERGDPIVIETEDAFYTYEVTSRLDQTDPSNTGVLDPIPTQGGFHKPGRYITLTTCTPEFTSTYRLIVWGQMVEERPRAEGMPDALVN